MIEEEKEVEILENSVIILSLHKRVKSTDFEDSKTQVINPRFVSKSIMRAKTVAYFSRGTAAFCLDKIVMYYNLHEDRGRIQNNWEEVKSLIEKICEMKFFNAGNIFYAKTYHIYQVVLQVHEENVQVIEDEHTKNFNLTVPK